MPTILAVDGNLDEIVRRALAAAGDRADEVQISTAGLHPGVSMPDDLARAAGFLADDPESDSEPEPEPEPAPEPVKAPAKRTTRTPAK